MFLNALLILAGIVRAETAWNINDIAPICIAPQFNAAATAGTWTLNSTPIFWQTFTAVPSAWANHDWLASLGYAMAAETGGPGPTLPPQMMMGVGQ